MKISAIYNLNKTQYELDFIDIDTDYDLPLFLDPHFLSNRKDHWSIEATRTIRSFFQYVIDLVVSGRIDEARNLFGYLGEPNETCLGLSTEHPRGRGVGPTDANAIFDAIIQSRAIQTGLVQDLQDCIIFVENIGKDKISDMTTNIIRKHLVKYTQNQCILWGIPMTAHVPTGFYWDSASSTWNNDYSEMLVIDDSKILLVPKGVVSFAKSYAPDRYYNHFILNFLQNEHLSLGTTLVQEYVRRDGTVKRFVRKRDVRAVSPYSKEFLRQFTLRNPQLFDAFKQNTGVLTKSISNADLETVDIDELIDLFIDLLQNIPVGRDDASNYHNLALGLMSFIFYPYLINPLKEREIHQGRKRVDITFDNAASEGFFYNLQHIHQIPCPYIFIECKNYSREIANPELDQIAGRFSPNRGKFGIILCRSIDDRALFTSRCRDTFIDERGLIIVLTDEDIIDILESIKKGIYNRANDLLTYRCREIILG